MAVFISSHSYLLKMSQQTMEYHLRLPPPQQFEHWFTHPWQIHHQWRRLQSCSSCSASPCCWWNAPQSSASEMQTVCAGSCQTSSLGFSLLSHRLRCDPQKINPMMMCLSRRPHRNHSQTRQSQDGENKRATRPLQNSTTTSGRPPTSVDCWDVFRRDKANDQLHT